jgi:hypothetical protein
VAASFIGSRRLGIHHALIFVDLPHDSRPLTPNGTPLPPRTMPVPARSPGLVPAATRASSHRLPYSPYVKLSSVRPRPRVAPPAAARPDDPLFHIPPAYAAQCLIVRALQWSRGDSNPGPPPCKGGALPAKLRPLARPDAPLVGAPGLEPGTSVLSGPRSNHLSYAPRRWCGPVALRRRRSEAPPNDPTARAPRASGRSGAPLAHGCPPPVHRPPCPTPCGHQIALDHPRMSLERR